jgi:hypothetical protein
MAICKKLKQHLFFLAKHGKLTCVNVKVVNSFIGIFRKKFALVVTAHKKSVL